MADDRDDLVSKYFHEGLTYEDIVIVLREHHGISISLRHLHRISRSLMLRRRVYSDARSVVDFVANAIENSGRMHGYRIMRQRCLVNGLRLRAQDVATILRIYDPAGTFLISEPNLIDGLPPFGSGMVSPGELYRSTPASC